MIINPQALQANGTVVWPTTPGLTYTVQTCDDLKVGNWVNMQTVTATTSVTSIVDAAMPALSRRAYRICYTP